MEGIAFIVDDIFSPLNKNNIDEETKKDILFSIKSAVIGL